MVGAVGIMSKHVPKTSELAADRTRKVIGAIKVGPKRRGQFRGDQGGEQLPHGQGGHKGRIA
jgi:hypothetical protein